MLDFFGRMPNLKSCFLDKNLLAFFRKNEHSLVAIELFTTTKTPPSTAEKYGVFTEYFFEERSRRCCGNRTATLDRERSEAFAKWREGLAACNGNRKSEALAEQII